MHWKFKKPNYNILVPKLEKNICHLNEVEAKAYFQWYMEQIPYRVNYVSKVCAEELRISVSRMDCTPESLVLLWKWFRHRAKTEPVSHENIQGKRMSPANAGKIEQQLSLETEYILRDIGMYLGETFRKNNPQIYWTYYTVPRRDFYVNRPLLKGFIDRTTEVPFEPAFEPIHMAHIQAAKIISKTSKDTDLLTIYNIWANKN